MIVNIEKIFDFIYHHGGAVKTHMATYDAIYHFIIKAITDHRFLVAVGDDNEYIGLATLHPINQHEMECHLMFNEKYRLLSYRKSFINALDGLYPHYDIFYQSRQTKKKFIIRKRKIYALH